VPWQVQGADGHDQRPGQTAGALTYQNITRSLPPDQLSPGTFDVRRLLPKGGRYVTGGPGVAAIGRYDSDLQMFVEEPRDVKREHLRFLRWLVERRRLEHPASGPPSGTFAMSSFCWISNRHCVPPRFGR
jgi:hypothetical protein